MKKYFTGITLLPLMVCGLISCNKDNPAPPASASLTVVNAIVGSAALYTNFSGKQQLQYYKTAQQIAANGFLEFGGYVGDVPLSLSQITDTLHTVYSSTLTIEPNSIHSLFLTGTLAAPDSYFTTDNVQAVTDSAVNIRFVNISTGINPVNIDISTAASTPVVSGLAYKSASDFQHFVAKKGIPASGSYIFEFRDAATNKLLTSYSLLSTAIIPAKLFKSITLVLKGTSTAPSVLLVNNY